MIEPQISFLDNEKIFNEYKQIYIIFNNTIFVIL